VGVRRVFRARPSDFQSCSPNETLVDALGRAVRRGVDVRLDLPGKTDLSSVLLAGQSNYAKLLESGVSIYERRGPDLHAS
jgi:cardiolipin synthase